MNASSQDDLNIDSSRSPDGAYPRSRLQGPINGEPPEDFDGQQLAWDGLASTVLHNLALMDEINAERARRKLPPLVLPSLQARKHNHYFRDVSRLSELDVYRVCDLFCDDRSGATQHAVKKLLLPGQRGAGKDRMKDLQEAIDTLNRRLEMMREDA